MIDESDILEALRDLLDVLPAESPIWDIVKWEEAVEQAKKVVAAADAREDACPGTWGIASNKGTNPRYK